MAERFDELERVHAQNHRHYHTGQHVEECLLLFDDLRDGCDEPDEVELAIWLHDAVYVPRRSDNEERSAELAEAWLRACAEPSAAATNGPESDTIERVRDLILATRHSGDPGTRDQRVLVDIDLHILGADPRRFDEYEEQVRVEYRWVPGPLFRRGRAEILEEFLARDPLYHTELCRERFEASARRNLERSRAALRG